MHLNVISDLINNKLLCSMYISVTLENNRGLHWPFVIDPMITVQIKLFKVKVCKCN